MPCARHSERSTFVAASTRISTLTLRFPPRRSTSRSCKTRSSFTCMGAAIVSTSSRNRVPPSASSILPARLCTAPVKAPFSYPNNSLSKSVSGKAPQLIATNCRVFRRLRLCIARATNSFPVPVSPVIMTPESVSAKDRIRSNTLSILELLLSIFSK